MMMDFNENGPMAAVIVDDIRRIADTAEERAAKSIWQKIGRSIEADGKAGRECRGAVQLDSRLPIAYCEEIHEWEAEKGTRYFIVRVLKEQGLLYLPAYAMDGEAFEIGYPIYQCRDILRNRGKEVKYTYTPGPNLKEIFRRVCALAEEEGFRLEYELVGHWYIWNRGAGAFGRDTVKDTGDETVVGNIFEEYVFRGGSDNSEFRIQNSEGDFSASASPSVEMTTGGDLSARAQSALGRNDNEKNARDDNEDLMMVILPYIRIRYRR